MGISTSGWVGEYLTVVLGEGFWTRRGYEGEGASSLACSYWLIFMLGSALDGYGSTNHAKDLALH